MEQSDISDVSIGTIKAKVFQNGTIKCWTILDIEWKIARLGYAHKYLKYKIVKFLFRNTTVVFAVLKLTAN